MSPFDRYTELHLAELADGLAKDREQLTSLIGLNLSHALRQDDRDVQEFLKWGVGRRLNVIQLAADRIFELFPPDRSAPLDRETIYEVQIYLHALISNLSGIFDCWAWAFILRHGFRAQFESVAEIGMFRAVTRKLLPSAIVHQARRIRKWHRYLKKYRDALAHRIPLYIPPAVLSIADQQRYQAIERQIDLAFIDLNFDQANRLLDQQKSLGRPCFTFHHGLTSEQTRGVFLHYQVLVDVATVTEFGTCFYNHWHESVVPT